MGDGPKMDFSTWVTEPDDDFWEWVEECLCLEDDD